MLTYSSFDPGKTVDAAIASAAGAEQFACFVAGAYFRISGAQQQTDAAARQVGLDAAAEIAKRVS